MHLVHRRAARGAGHILQRGGLARQLGQLLGAQGIAAKVLHVAQAQLLHLAQHGARLRVQAAVEDRVGLLVLDGGEDGHEVGGLVVGELLGHHLQALLLRRGLEDRGHALAVGRAVVDDGHVLELEVVRAKQRQRSAQRVVVGDEAESGLVAGLGQVGVGGRGRDVGQVALGVDGRRRNGRARLQVAHHACHLLVAQLLRHGGGLAWVARVVFGRDFKLDLLAADDEVLGVQVVNGQTHAVFRVLADVGNAARHRACVADLDGLHVLGGGQVGRQRKGGQGRNTEQGRRSENGAQHSTKSPGSVKASCCAPNLYTTNPAS